LFGDSEQIEALPPSMRSLLITVIVFYEEFIANLPARATRGHHHVQAFQLLAGAP
jgi:hypothetical protein